MRVHAGGRKTYVVQTRSPAGRLKRVTLGRDGKMTAEEARRSAAEVIYRIRRGEEPFPAPVAPEPTMVDLAGRFMKAHVEANSKPGTVKSFRRTVDLHMRHVSCSVCFFDGRVCPKTRQNLMLCVLVYLVFEPLVVA